MKAIKLLEIDATQDGTRRFQTQLSLGKDSADFVMGNDNIIKVWGNGDKGFNFYPFIGDYQIVSDRKEMLNQIL